MSATPTIDRARLRTFIQGAPDTLKATISATFREGSWPSLAPESEWTPEALYVAAEAISHLAVESGHAFPVPVETDTLRARIVALPADLADRAAEEAATCSIPNVGHANKWSPALWLEADRIISTAEELAAVRLRRIHAALGDAGITTEEERHIALLTLTGRTESSKQLTGPEAKALAEWAEGRSLGKGPALPEPFAPDWKVEAKALATTQGELLKEAKAWAKVRRLDVPKTLAEVTDHRMIAALLMRADDGTTKVMAAADAALPPETSPVPSLTPEVGEEVVVPEGNPGTTAAPDPNPQVEGETLAGVLAAIARNLAQAFTEAAADLETFLQRTAEG